MKIRVKGGKCSEEEFVRRFYELRDENPESTYVQVYFMVEQEHVERFGRTRWSSYDSFRKVLARNLS